ncbi:MAG: hypothetical protein ACT4PS_15590 [Betaproteobacteria bacterium]
MTAELGFMNVADAARRIAARKLSPVEYTETARRAGLNLDEYLTAILLETAPFALAIAERVRKPRSRAEEPALVFRVPN